MPRGAPSPFPEFFSITYRLFKLPDLETECEDYGQVAYYKGTQGLGLPSLSLFAVADNSCSIHSSQAPSRATHTHTPWMTTTCLRRVAQCWCVATLHPWLANHGWHLTLQ